MCKIDKVIGNLASCQGLSLQAETLIFWTKNLAQGSLR